MRPSESATAAVIAGNQLKISGGAGDTELRVDLPSTLPAGRYRLDLAVQRAGGERQMVGFPVSWLEN